MPPPLVVADILEIFAHASTTPCLVVTEGGERWVMKLVGSGAGIRGSITELIGGRIARAMGAPVPALHPIFLPHGFPWRVGTDEFDDMLQRSYGWNVGVAYLERARPVGADEIPAFDPVPLGRIAASDSFLQNMDRTAHNPNLLLSPSGLHAIDYDACLFLDRAIAQRTPYEFALPQAHLLAGMTLPGAPAAFPFECLGEVLQDVPVPWLEACGVEAHVLSARLAAYARAFAAREPRSREDRGP